VHSCVFCVLMLCYKVGFAITFLLYFIDEVVTWSDSVHNICFSLSQTRRIILPPIMILSRDVLFVLQMFCFVV